MSESQFVRQLNAETLESQRYLKEFLSTSNSNLSTTQHYRAENSDLATHRATLENINPPEVHSSEAPFVLNVKIEEDIDIKQEEDIQLIYQIFS